VVVHLAKQQEQTAPHAGPAVLRTVYEVFGTVKEHYHAPWRTWTRGKWTSVKKAREMADLIGRDLEERFHSPRPYELVHGAPPDSARRTSGRKSKKRNTGRKRKTGRK
jgi:hypothetical protein